MNGTHQVLTYADDISLRVDDIRTIERNADVLLNACKGICLVINTGKTKYMEAGCHPGMLVNEHITVDSNSYEKVKIFKHFGSLLRNEDYFQGKIKCELKGGNSYYYSVQILSSSQLLSV